MSFDVRLLEILFIFEEAKFSKCFFSLSRALDLSSPNHLYSVKQLVFYIPITLGIILNSLSFFMVSELGFQWFLVNCILLFSRQTTSRWLVPHQLVKPQLLALQPLDLQSQLLPLFSQITTPFKSLNIKSMGPIFGNGLNRLCWL